MRGNRADLGLLATLAALSALIYALAFSLPYNLVAQQSPPYHPLSDLTGGSRGALAWLVAAFLALGLLYWLGWRLARRVRGPAAWAIVAGGAVTFAGILLLMYPIGAADIFANIMYGRIVSVYGGNPFFDAGTHFAGDRFFPYMAWSGDPTPYGPLCVLLFVGAGQLAGGGVVANVLALKLLNALFLAASIAVVAATLRDAAPGWALPGALALAWNPIVLYETIGNGHNDIIMAFWVLAAVGCMARRRYTWAVLALVAGALIKIVPILLLPAAGLIALRQLRTGRAQLRFALGAGASALALAGLVYLPFWRGPATLTFLQRRGLFTTSLPALLNIWLASRWDADRAATIAGYLAWAAAALFALWQAYRTRWDPSWQSFPRAAFNIFLFYLLFTCAWFKEWYTIWPLALAAVLPSGQALALAILFNYTGMAQPLLVWPLWIDLGEPNPMIPELRLTLTAMALPWAYLALQGLRRWLRARQGAATDS